MRQPAALVAAIVFLCFPSAVTAAARIAIVVGNDVGLRSEKPLRYAQSDARRMADVLATVGEVDPTDVVLLEGRPAETVREAIVNAESRLLRTGGGVLLVYYSGHADAEALHLGATVLPLRELQAILRASAVATRLLIIDACRAGALTYMKGGSPGGHFETPEVTDPTPRGMAIVASSAAGEDAQESDELRASFFTHHLATGLLGAADSDGDGSVTLAETFAYTARHTAESTATTWAGPQHPTFKLDLGGREDLVLSHPGAPRAQLGYLTMSEPGNYFIRREGEAGLVAEVSTDAAARPLALRAGRYEVTRRAANRLLIGTFPIVAAVSTEVTESQMRRIEFGRAVRKGGAPSNLAFSVFAASTYRGSLLGLGDTLGIGIGGRVELRRVSAAITADFGAGSFEGFRATRLETSEFSVRACLGHAFDLSRLTLLLGGVLGMSRFDQAASDQPLLAKRSYAANAGPTAEIELPLGGRFFATVQATVPAYLLSVESTDHVAQSHVLRVTYRLSVTIGGAL